jgi:Domain of unknown function (DUF4747)
MNYVFRHSDHKLFFESRSFHKHSFGPSSVKRFFQRAFDIAKLNLDISEVHVSIVPNRDALEKVLSLAQINQLTIRLLRPNPDDITDDVGRWMAKLEAMQASKFDQILTKSKQAETLAPDNETLALARVASNNGYVKARGKNADGVKQVSSTEEYPLEIVLTTDDTRAALEFLLNSLRAHR